MAALEYLLEGAVVVLLGATIFYAARLEKALKTIRDDREAITKGAADFKSAVSDADSSVSVLRATVEGAGKRVEQRVADGEKLRDELKFLLDRGEALAGRLESLVTAARPLENIAQSVAVSQPAPPVTGTPIPPGARSHLEPVRAEPRIEPRSKAEQELVDLLRGTGKR